MDKMNETIDRYKQDMMRYTRDKSKDRERLQAYTEQLVESEAPATATVSRRQAYTEHLEEDCQNETPRIEWAQLRVLVCDEGTGTPVSGASVAVSFFSDENREELAAFVSSGEDGWTPTLKLRTGRSYVITVSAEGYAETSVEGVRLTANEKREETLTLARNDSMYEKACVALAAGNAAIERVKLREVCAFPIRLGDEGECVKQLQTRLCILGGVFDFMPPRTTGQFGQNTASAVGRVQRLFGLPIDYCVDETTWEAIFAASDAVNMPNETDQEAQMCIKFPKNCILALGDTNEDVLFLQLALMKMGKRFVNITPMCPNGVFDETTQNNVRTLQTILGLPVTGRVAHGTMSAILKILN